MPFNLFIRSLLSLTSILWIISYATAGTSEHFRPYAEKDYKNKNFNVTSRTYTHGAVTIRVTEAKKVGDKPMPPHACRAWLEVKTRDKIAFRKYWDDMEPVAFSYGLIVPKHQLPAPYFAVVKNGDYDGRLYLIRDNGKVTELLGGFFFLAKNQRYLFSEYTSDAEGLAVYDLKEDKLVFSSDKLPYVHQWYEKNGNIFFTESEWSDNSGVPHAKPGIAYWYDFNSHKVVQRALKNEDLKGAKEVQWSFDPRQYDDCSVAPNNSFNPSSKP